MAHWLVKTTDENDLDQIEFQLDLNILSRDSRGVVFDCPYPEDEDALVEYCETFDIELELL